MASVNVEMPVEDVQPVPPVTETTLGRPVSDDGVRIHAHVFSFQFKPTIQPDFKKQLFKRVKKEGDSKRAKAHVDDYANQLSSRRVNLIRVLERRGSELAIPDGPLPEFEEYAALLVGLAFDSSSQTIESETKPPEGQNHRLSTMRNSVDFSWHDVLLNRQNVASRDVIFELVSIILVLVGARTRFVAYNLRDTRGGSPTPQVSQAFRVLTQAARELDLARRHLCPILGHSSGSADCTPEAIKSLCDVVSGDVQSISTLRGMAKASSPGLISGLALWAADSYRSASHSARAAPFATSTSKLQQYAEFKAVFFRAYALTFAGLSKLKEDKGGEAVKLINEAQNEAKQSIPLAANFNKAEPSTPAAEHSEFDADLKICVESALKRATKENDQVYYQKVPNELPELPGPRKVVPETNSYNLPVPSQIVKELQSLEAFSAVPVEASSQIPASNNLPPNSPPVQNPQPAGAQTNSLAGEKKPEEKEESTSCFKWLLVIIAMPLLAMTSIMGIIIWIILLPVKIICCPLGCLVQIIADVVEYIVKAPAKALLWASGKPYNKKKPRDEESQ